MPEAPQPFWVSRTRSRPGGLALRCGVILFLMGFAVFAWDRKIIEGPPEDQLVPVQATVQSIKCEVWRNNARSGPKEYGQLTLLYEYEYGGHVRLGSRYQRQNLRASAEQCRQLERELSEQPKVRAWVDPAEPSFSTLTKHVHGTPGTHIFMGVGAALTALGVYRRLRFSRASKAQAS